MVLDILLFVNDHDIIQNSNISCLPPTIEETGYEARQTSKEQTKMPRFMLEGSRPCTIFNLFCAHTLCMNYVTNTFLLVSFSVRSKQLLCVVQGQVQKSEQKHKTKSIDEFHKHSPLLTMPPRTHFQ